MVNSFNLALTGKLKYIKNICKMEKIDLKVGQKAWSIQLGDCIVENIHKGSSHPFTCRDSNGNIAMYTEGGKLASYEVFSSLYYTSPFELQPLEDIKTTENKADLIIALCKVLETDSTYLTNLKDIARDKMEKLLKEI